MMNEIDLLYNLYLFDLNYIKLHYLMFLMF